MTPIHTDHTVSGFLSIRKVPVRVMRKDRKDGPIKKISAVSPNPNLDHGKLFFVVLLFSAYLGMKVRPISIA